MSNQCIDGDQMCHCGYLKRDHLLANYADGPFVGAPLLVCPRSTFEEFVEKPVDPDDPNTPTASARGDQT